LACKLSLKKRINNFNYGVSRSLGRNYTIPRRYSIFLPGLYFFSILIIFSCARPESSRAEFALGTVCHITLFEQGRDKVYNDVFARIREIENLMSINISSSDISRVNAAAGIEPVPVHEETFAVIQRALYYAKLSDGVFDPSVGPLVSLWGIGGDKPRVPLQEEIDETMPLVNWRDIEIDPVTRSVFLKRRGMALDLGAVAKGYAADEAAAIIKNAGIERAIIDLGGNIVTLGQRSDKNPWRIGIQNPNDDRNKYIGVLQVTENSVVTSGVYERFFEEEGRRYHHIFLPESGYPVENGLLSVTIIAHNSIDADALSTAVFVLGYERGRELIDSLFETEAVFIFNDLSVRKTSGANFSLTDKTFRLEE
jgi:thiamine biosynthesis lipoprotein